MQAREIKALIHRSCAVDVIGALRLAGFRGVSLIDASSHPMVLEARQRKQLPTGGQDDASLVKIELMCDNETQTAQAIALIRDHAIGTAPWAGRVYISELLTTVELGG